MVDCFDRIAVQMTEIALEPVRLLRDRALLTAVTLRTPSNGKRINITIEKRFPNGPSEAPTYHWALVEVDLAGNVIADGIRAESAAHLPYRQPEDAYWGAVDALCAVQRTVRTA